MNVGRALLAADATFWHETPMATRPLVLAVSLNDGFGVFLNFSGSRIIILNLFDSKDRLVLFV